MGMPIVIVAVGGLPVTLTNSAYGLPMTISSSGGLPVTVVTSGGWPVTGFTTGPDVTAPVITSANTVSNVENTVLAHTLAANEAVTWAIVAGGADNARFELSGSTLRWLANGVKDFEAPNDADTNNAYIVTVRATDLASNPSTTQTITVTVTDAVGIAPSAPVLLLTSGPSDNTPDFTLTGDLQLSDTVRFQYSTSAVFSGASEITNAIDAGEDAANTLNFSTGALANGTWYFRARIERPGTEAAVSAWSNTESVTVAVGGGSTTWAPASANANIVLSNGNLDVTANAGYKTMPTLAGKSSGKWYFEVEVISFSSNAGYGLMDETALGAPIVDYLGNFTNSAMAFVSTDTNFVSGFTGVGTPTGLGPAPLAAGVIIGIAFDATAKQAWIAKTNSWLASGNPAAGTTPWLTWSGSYTIHGAVTLDNAAMRLHSTLTYTPPSGFSQLG